MAMEAEYSSLTMNKINDDIRLRDEEEKGLMTGDIDEVNQIQGNVDLKYCLVGRFLSDRVINFQAMKNTMASLWRPGKGVHIRELSASLYLFQFFHEIDMKRVIDGGHWTFNNHLLLIKRLGLKEQPHAVTLHQASFWVQILNLPVGFMSKKVLRSIGNYIGTFEEFDVNNLIGYGATT